MTRITSEIFRISYIILPIILTFLIYAASASASGPYDFWIKTPNSWQDKRDSLGNDLVRQLVAPDGNAFIEVYAARGANPGLQAIADGMESGIRQRGGAFLQNRVSSSSGSTGDGQQGIAREYTGNHNGIPLKAVGLYTYGNGKAIVVFGVFVAAMEAQYRDLVYRSILSFRFSPPDETGNRCSGIVGRWHWFTGNTAEFHPNGKVPGTGNSWQCVDPKAGVVRIVWNNGKWVDTLNLSADGKRLEGKNQRGDRVWGKRLANQ
jgi:hypothetical protein